MKKLLSFVLAGTLLVSCSDYDDRFDSLNSAVQELAAENAALEAQIAAMQGASAQAAQATAARLAEFQSAVAGIVVALQTLGTASEATIAQVSAIIQAMSDLADLVASNSATNAELEAALAEIEAMLALLNTNVLHHSGGGSTDGSGSEHHSGGGSTDDGGSEATTTSYLPTYTGVFGGYTVVDNVHTFPAGAEGWAGVANENADIYPLTFDDGGTITFTASSAGDDVGIYFRFERLPYPNVDPAFNTAKATISGSTATEYTINIDAQAVGTTYSSALLYLDTRDVAVTITDITITVPN